MITAIAGTYLNGQIKLDRIPKNIKKKAKVLVIFEEEVENVPTEKSKRQFGISKGMIELSPDFNEPLEELKEYM